MLVMDEISDTRQQELITFVKRQMNGESIRTVASRAGISHGVLGDLLTGGHIPKADTLKKLAPALGTSEARLLHLAGYLDEIPTASLNQQAAQLAERITNLPPRLRVLALASLDAQLDAIHAASGSQNESARLSEPGETEQLRALVEDLTATIRQIQEAAMGLQGGDMSTPKKEQQTNPANLTEAMKALPRALVEKILRDAEEALKRVQQSEVLPS